jgi:hypothetical protein
MTTIMWADPCVTCHGVGEPTTITTDDSYESVWEKLPSTAEECRDCLGTGECPIGDGGEPR